MKLIFFNLCVSPHQMPYINELAHRPEVDYVAFVAPYIDIDERVDMGWHSEDNMNDGAVEFFIAPTKDKVAELLKRNEGMDTHCIFSGINAFKQVAVWFRLSLKYDVRRALMTEPPMIYKRPLWMHAIRFAFKDWKYTKYIDNVFVTGDRFVPYYQFWDKRWNVWPFMYCTNLKSDVGENERPNDERLHMVYVGELCHRKNVKVLLKAMTKIEGNKEKIDLSIVGDGKDRYQLEEYARKNGLNVTFHGRQPMNRVADYMKRADVLVLPSRHDGWGAVVNEALSMGTYVICSDHCGARYLINKLSFWHKDMPGCGMAFISNDEADLKRCINTCIEKIKDIRASIGERIDWSKRVISHETLARYMIEKLTTA